MYGRSAVYSAIASRQTTGGINRQHKRKNYYHGLWKCAGVFRLRSGKKREGVYYPSFHGRVLQLRNHSGRTGVIRRWYRQEQRRGWYVCDKQDTIYDIDAAIAVRNWHMKLLWSRLSSYHHLSPFTSFTSLISSLSSITAACYSHLRLRILTQQLLQRTNNVCVSQIYLHLEVY